MQTSGPTTVSSRALIFFCQIFLLSALFLLFAGCEESQTDKGQRQEEERPLWEKYRAPSPKGEGQVLIADMNGDVFTVPEDYVGQSPPNYPAFDVIAYFPEMVPVTWRNEEKYESADIVRMLFRLDLDRSYPEKITLLTRAIEQGWVKEPSLSSIYPGLLEYRNAETDRLWLFRANDPPVTTPVGNPLVIGCNERIRTFGPGHWECQTQVHLPRGVLLIYRFSSKNLPNWQALHAAVLRLTESFKGE